MGFDASEVTWVDASFDQSIQPGQKNFDFNLQQFSITAERDRIVDFSVPYYTSAMAVVVRQPTIDRGGSATHASLKNLVWGADANTTALPLIQGLIAPATAPLLYDDNTDVLEAMRANQIDAALFDLPTALYLAAVVLDDGAVLGQFPANRSESPDQLGLLMEEGNPIKTGRSDVPARCAIGMLFLKWIEKPSDEDLFKHWIQVPLLAIFYSWDVFPVRASALLHDAAQSIVVHAIAFRSKRIEDLA